MYKCDAHAALELIQEAKITGMASVPAVIQDLLYHSDFDRFTHKGQGCWRIDADGFLPITGRFSAAPAVRINGRLQRYLPWPAP